MQRGACRPVDPARGHRDGCRRHVSDGDGDAAEIGKSVRSREALRGRNVKDKDVKDAAVSSEGPLMKVSCLVEHHLEGHTI